MLLGVLKSALRVIASSLEYRDEYGTLCLTKRGEQVKSRGEKRIADYLYRNNILYQYEKPLVTGWWIFKEKLANPDFYLPEFNVYVEYWGLVDTRSYRVRAEYTKVMKWKMAHYHKNKVKFISIYPSNLNNLDWVFKAKLREATGIELETLLPPPSLSHPFRNMAKPRAARGQGALIKLLGPHSRELVIEKTRDGLVISQRTWMKKEDWSEVNRILRNNGFVWLSNGRNSCWIKSSS